jgi:hypothetical protein
MQENSSPDTRSRSKNLATAIGSYHLDLNIDGPYKAVVLLFSTVTSYVPKFKVYGGTNASNLSLQCLQARLRMVLSYLFAQLLPTVRGRNADNPENSSPGGLLVLGSANVDESLVSTFLFLKLIKCVLAHQWISDQVILTPNFPQRGYLTKYDVRTFSESPFSSSCILSSGVLHLKQLGNIPGIPDQVILTPRSSTVQQRRHQPNRRHLKNGPQTLHPLGLNLIRHAPPPILHRCPADS